LQLQVVVVVVVGPVLALQVAVQQESMYLTAVKEELKALVARSRQMVWQF
jgi:hypothetical protein